MDVALILKVGGVGILVSVLYQILSKSGREEQAMMVNLAGIIIVLLMLVGEMGSLIDTVRGIFGI
ncbi:MAG: stage III sporulation protein AC [Eubacteriales bacterium]